MHDTNDRPRYIDGGSRAGELVEDTKPCDGDCSDCKCEKEPVYKREFSPSEFDAEKWAEEWLYITASKPHIASDKDTMRAWFANAIMAGYAIGKKHTKESVIEHLKDC